MSLGIFSFDLAALINSLYDIIDIANDDASSTEVKTSLDKAAEILQTAIVKNADANDAQMADALNTAVTSVIANLETGKNADQKMPPTNKETPPTNKDLPPSKVQFDEATRREIERIIQSLQTSVNYSYQSTDSINDNIYRNNVNNFQKKQIPQDLDNKEIESEKHRQQLKTDLMQEELKKAMFKHKLLR